MQRVEISILSIAALFISKYDFIKLLFSSKSEYKKINKKEPDLKARNEIIDLLANMRRVEFMRQVKEDLYNQSMEVDRIKYYENEAIQTVDDIVCGDDNRSNGSAK